MTVTLQNLIDACEADLNDRSNAIFNVEDIEQWCRDAIADYSLHFHTAESTTIDCADNTRQYDLPLRLLDIISVEYPKGQDPPQFLQKRPVNHPEFWYEDGYYDIRYHNSHTAADVLLISTKPSTGHDIEVNWIGMYDNTMLPSTAITVPGKHQHILRQYVNWRAVVKLKAAEEANPTSNSSLLMSQLAINVDRARRAYTDALAKALFAISKSAVVSWAGQDESSKRIY
jgi:hypothetical protein